VKKLPFLLAVLMLLSSCAAWPWTKTAWDQWRAICGKDLAARADVAAEASARNLSVKDFAEALCELSDVVAPFVRSTQTEAKSAALPGDQAVAAARSLGVMR
jgi:hypothetical protein